MMTMNIEIGEGRIYIISDMPLTPGITDVLKVHGVKIDVYFHAEREDVGSWTSQCTLHHPKFIQGKIYLAYIVEGYTESAVVDYESIPFTTYKMTTWVENGKDRRCEWTYEIPMRVTKHSVMLQSIGLGQPDVETVGKAIADSDWDVLQNFCDEHPELLTLRE